MPSSFVSVQLDVLMKTCIHNETETSLLDLEGNFQVKNLMRPVQEFSKVTAMYADLPITDDWSKIDDHIRYLGGLSADPNKILFPSTPQVPYVAV
jgi:hypothetical protein